LVAKHAANQPALQRVDLGRFCALDTAPRLLRRATQISPYGAKQAWQGTIIGPEAVREYRDIRHSIYKGRRPPVTVRRPLPLEVLVSRAISSQPPRDPKVRWVSAACLIAGRIPLLWETIIDVRKF